MFTKKKILKTDKNFAKISNFVISLTVNSLPSQC